MVALHIGVGIEDHTAGELGDDTAVHMEIVGHCRDMIQVHLLAGWASLAICMALHSQEIDHHRWRQVLVYPEDCCWVDCVDHLLTELSDWVVVMNWLECWVMAGEPAR